MTTKQEEFFNVFSDGVMKWLVNYHDQSSESPRSDWIIYALMALAGGILAQAPKDIRGSVLVEALAHFGETSGARVDSFDLGQGEPPPPGKFH